MSSGIKIKEKIVGTGAAAARGKETIVHIRGFLNRGEEFYNTHAQSAPTRISLAGRDSIAGLRRGILGMRTGGQRELIVSPHLAYGEKGVPGLIPPNSVLRFEVELARGCATMLSVKRARFSKRRGFIGLSRRR